MEINPVNPLSETKNSGKSAINKSSEVGGKSFQDEFKKSVLSGLIDSLKSKMAKDNTEAAFDIFISGYETPGFAEKILESAPIFAAFVAKMDIDEIMAKLDLEKEKARELKTLAEKYSQEARRVGSI